MEARLVQALKSLAFYLSFGFTPVLFRVWALMEKPQKPTEAIKFVPSGGGSEPLLQVLHQISSEGRVPQLGVCKPLLPRIPHIPPDGL